MSSLNYFVLELSSAESHETKQANSLYLNTKEQGDIGILPNHEPQEYTLAGQIMHLTLASDVEKSEKAAIPLYVSQGHLKISIEGEGRSKVQITCFEYEFLKQEESLEEAEKDSLYQQKSLEYMNLKSKSSNLLKTELFPSLGPSMQEMRDIDGQLRKEFETKL
jgi:F0F1-type ATP synthase epsilon subunit